MKQISFILNLVLLVAVAVLYFFHFSDKSTSPAPSASIPEGGVSIAYVNVDSLFNSYDYYESLMSNFKTKSENARKQYEDRDQELRKEMVSLEKRAKAGLMTKNEMVVVQKEMAEKQQSLQKFQQALSEGLIEEEKQIQKKLVDNITQYLEKYNEDKKYSVILNYLPGTTFWVADEGLDITRNVIDGLNGEFASTTEEGETK